MSDETPATPDPSPAADGAEPTSTSTGGAPVEPDPAGELPALTGSAAREQALDGDDDPDTHAGDFTSSDVDLSHLTVVDDEEGGDTDD